MDLRITAHTIQEAEQSGLEHVTIIRTDVDPRPLLAALPRVRAMLRYLEHVSESLDKRFDLIAYKGTNLALIEAELRAGFLSRHAEIQALISLFDPTATPEQSPAVQFDTEEGYSDSDYNPEEDPEYRARFSDATANIEDARLS